MSDKAESCGRHYPEPCGKRCKGRGTRYSERQIRARETREAFRFHQRHSAGRVGHAAEDGLSLARAEIAFLEREGETARFRFEDEDTDPADLFCEQRDIDAVRAEKYAWVCAVLEVRDDADGRWYTAASLGGIALEWSDIFGGAVRGYARTIRAELASEAGIGERDPRTYLLAL